MLNLAKHFSVERRSFGEVTTSGNTAIENKIADSPKQFYSTICLLIAFTFSRLIVREPQKTSTNKPGCFTAWQKGLILEHLELIHDYTPVSKRKICFIEAQNAQPLTKIKLLILL